MARKSNKVSLKEFQAWLQGVEELQDKDWAPTLSQWKLIRGKIDCITEPKPEKVIVKEVVSAPINGVVGNIPQQQIPGISPPPITGGVPQTEAVMSPAAKQMLNPVGGGNAKTPDIDTSDGNVQSSFA